MIFLPAYSLVRTDEPYATINRIYQTIKVMSGAGFAMDAIKRTRGNRSLIKKKGAFEIQKSNTFKGKSLGEYSKYAFKETTPTYLASLREQLRQDKARRLLNTSIALIVAAGATIYLLAQLP